MTDDQRNTPDGDEDEKGLPQSTTQESAKEEPVLPGIERAIGEIREDTGETMNKLPVTASFDELVAVIPEVRATVGMDQKSDYHSLTLDEHHKELVRRLLEDPYLEKHPKRNLVVLTGNLHDLGKTSLDGQQIHPKDSAKRQYVGHEKESARIISELLPKYFVDMPEEDRQFIIKLAGLHASALNLVTNFVSNKEPKGKQLKAYDKFIAKVEEIPGDMSIEEKMRIVFALNRADKLAGVNDESDRSDSKVQGIIARAEEEVTALDELEKALPVLIQAVQNRRNGDQNAGITYQDGEYKLLEPPKKAAQALDGKQIGAVMRNFDTIDVPVDQKAAFAQALREGGISGLGKAGFGKYIGTVKKILGE